MAAPNLDDYVDVAERIQQFYEKYPDGRLTEFRPPVFRLLGDRNWIIYTAAAYRDHDDKIPAIGTAWEEYPGKSNFTRDSELMNAETSAWGRAIVAVGIGSKKVASREEVQARTSPVITDPGSQALGGEKVTVTRTVRSKVTADPVKKTEKAASPKQRNLVAARARSVGASDTDLRIILQGAAGVSQLERLPASQVDAVLAQLKEEDK